MRQAERDTKWLDPTRTLLHPLFWGALALLLLNDHVLKGAGLLPGAVTGKLSDVAGLVVAPIVLAVVCRIRSTRGMWAAVLAVGTWFTAVNTVPAVARGWEALTSMAFVPWTLWCDPTDLLALPALGVSAWLMLNAAERPRRRMTETVLAIAGAVGCVATSAAAPQPPVSSPGKVVSPSGSGPVFVIDAATGRRMAAPNLQRAGATLEIDGVLYAITGRRVIGVSLDSEEEVMRVEYEKGAFYDVLDTDGTHLFMIAHGGANERAVAIDLRTKKLLWDVALHGRDGRRTTSREPIVAGGLFIVPVGKRVVAIEPATGRRKWEHIAGSPVGWLSSDGGTAFGVDGDGTIVALDMENGNVLWTYAVGSSDGFRDGYREAPKFGAGSGVVVFMRGDGTVVAIDASTRAPRWQGPKVEDLVVGETIAVGTMEIDDDRHFVAMRLDDGAKLWKLNADDWSATDPRIDEQNGIVLVQPFYDELRAYTMKGGVLMWRFLLDEGQRAEFLETGMGAGPRRRGAVLVSPRPL